MTQTKKKHPIIMKYLLIPIFCFFLAISSSCAQNCDNRFLKDVTIDGRQTLNMNPIPTIVRHDYDYLFVFTFRIKTILIII